MSDVLGVAIPSLVEAATVASAVASAIAAVAAWKSAAHSSADLDLRRTDDRSRRENGLAVLDGELTRLQTIIGKLPPSVYLKDHPAARPYAPEIHSWVQSLIIDMGRSWPLLVQLLTVVDMLLRSFNERFAAYDAALDRADSAHATVNRARWEGGKIAWLPSDLSLTQVSEALAVAKAGASAQLAQLDETHSGCTRAINDAKAEIAAIRRSLKIPGPQDS